jgi:hypothetical protein
MGTMIRERNNIERAKRNNSHLGQKDHFNFSGTHIARDLQKSALSSQVKASREHTISKIETEKLHGAGSGGTVSGNSSNG